MSRRTGLILFVSFVALFLLLNRGAYRGYFQADELDNLAWTPNVPLAHYGLSVVSPRFEPNNFRPVGHFYFYLCEKLFHLDFPKWVAALQAIHLLNVWLLWLVLRRLGAPPLASGAACLFYGLHMALFDAMWKPMYVFDVLCGTFCLLAIFSYRGRRYVSAFVCFWLAYKAKEVAVMLPLVLAAVELWFGSGSWKRRCLTLAPFFLASLSFGLQGLLLNPNQDNDYTFRFTPAALAQTSFFYACRVFLIPYLGFAVLIAPVLLRNRRAWLGMAAMLALFFPLLFLPGRMYSAYCYVPFIGLAAVFSVLAERTHWVALAAFFLLWGIHDIRLLREDRRATLALDNEVRQWVTTLGRYARTAQKPGAVVYAGEIPGFAAWGEVGAVHYVFRDNNIPVAHADDPHAGKLRHAPGAITLNWNNGTHNLYIRGAGPEVTAAYIRMDGSEPVDQLLAGWYGLEGDFRWTEPVAVAPFGRPAGANRFELRVMIGDAQIHTLKTVTIAVTLDGRELEPRRLSRPGWQTLTWDLPPAPAGTVKVTVTTSPAFHPTGDSRTLGAAVGGLGFQKQL